MAYHQQKMSDNIIHMFKATDLYVEFYHTNASLYMYVQKEIVYHAIVINGV